MEPIAAYFSQIGQLHTVQHIWRYDSLEQRKATRDAAWQVETWNDTVTKVGNEIMTSKSTSMDAHPLSSFYNPSDGQAHRQDARSNHEASAMEPS